MFKFLLISKKKCENKIEGYSYNAVFTTIKKKYGLNMVRILTWICSWAGITFFLTNFCKPVIHYQLYTIHVYSCRSYLHLINYLISSKISKCYKPIRTYQK